MQGYICAPQLAARRAAELDTTGSVKALKHARSGGRRRSLPRASAVQPLHPKAPLQTPSGARPRQCALPNHSAAPPAAEIVPIPKDPTLSQLQKQNPDVSRPGDAKGDGDVLGLATRPSPGRPANTRGAGGHDASPNEAMSAGAEAAPVQESAQAPVSCPTVQVREEALRNAEDAPAVLGPAGGGSPTEAGSEACESLRMAAMGEGILNQDAGEEEGGSTTNTSEGTPKEQEPPATGKVCASEGDGLEGPGQQAGNREATPPPHGEGVQAGGKGMDVRGEREVSRQVSPPTEVQPAPRGARKQAKPRKLSQSASPPESQGPLAAQTNGQAPRLTPSPPDHGAASLPSAQTHGQTPIVTSPSLPRKSTAKGPPPVQVPEVVGGPAASEIVVPDSAASPDGAEGRNASPETETVVPEWLLAGRVGKQRQGPGIVQALLTAAGFNVGDLRGGQSVRDPGCSSNGATIGAEDLDGDRYTHLSA